MNKPPNSRVNLDKAIERHFGTDWESLYAAQSANVPVLPTVEEAIAWTQRLVERIDAAR